MKNINLVIFTVLMSILMGALYLEPMKAYQFRTAYKERKKLDLATKVEGRNKDREDKLRNVETGLIDANDWYQALSVIKSKFSQLGARGEDLKWTQRGPDQVGGRVRAFVFDNQKSSRCYTAGVAGGMYVSEDLGHSWKTVEDMADSFSIMSIGSMTQSKNGDIYAGTGEFWGNPVTGTGGANFYGNGIYKKEAGQNKWTLLPSTITTSINKADNNGNFQSVVDMEVDPENNDVVWAATTKGLFKSVNAGESWSKINGSVFSGLVAQIKIGKAQDGSVIIYAGATGKVYKSTNDGNTWTDMIGSNTKYQADGNRHMRIALSSSDANKLYVVGIDGSNNYKYIINSVDGGVNWRSLGSGNSQVNPCNQDGNNLACQGWYDLALACHPKNDGIIFLGGAPAFYTWSDKYGWVTMSSGYNGNLGTNEVHADHHGFAFHKNADTMVILTDGGPYISYNSTTAFPNITWKPRLLKLNITQFYDMAVNKYGELVGGSQDNGTQFITLKGASTSPSFEISGGDGFDCAISANNDHKVAFTTVYNGTLNRTDDLSSNRKNIVTGCAATADGKISGADNTFHTKIHLAEIVTDIPDGIDTTVQSLLFGFSGGQFTISPNASNPKTGTQWSEFIAPGVGSINAIHQAKDFSVFYFAGSTGMRKATNLKSIDWKINQSIPNQPCLTRPSINFSNLTGLSSNISSVFVHQGDPKYVVAVQQGFGGPTKVFFSEDGTLFSGKQGNLPVMPLYACAIDPTDHKHVVVGGEFGIWETDDITVVNPTWKEQNKVIGRVPVYTLEVKHLRKIECPVLYAGTMGRGFFNAPFPDLTSSGCDYSLKPRVSSSLEQVNRPDMGFAITPNPSSDQINITFKSKSSQMYTLAIYDLNGRMVKRIQYKTIVGDNIISTEINTLQNGNYVVRLEDAKSVIGGKIFTKN